MIASARDTVFVRPALIPARRQTLWRTPAVLNFFLGGLGGGFYAVAAVVSGLDAHPALALASWLGPALAALGFLAVATEAGRPFRGVRVLTRPRSSWMSREMWVGGAFIVLALAEFVTPGPALRGLAALAAVGFVLTQGLILRAARGVAAWSVPSMPLVFLASAALSGTGLLLVHAAATGGPATADLAASFGLLILGIAAWLAYLFSTDDPAFVAATASLRRGSPGLTVLVAGYVAPVVLLALAVLGPAHAPLYAGVAGFLIVAGQACAKWALVRQAGCYRPVTVATLTIRRIP